MALVCLILDLVPGDHSKVQYGASSCTWLSSRSGYIYAFFVPIGISLVFNFVCFIMTLYFIEKAMASTEVTIGKKRDKKRCLMYVRLSSVMGFTWIFGFIASTTNISVLWYVYIILNGLQGVFIFLSFCLNSRNKDMIKAKMSESRFTNIFTANTETTSARSKTDDEDTKQVTSRKI
ncbi:hypothetical protein LOTGIDRAFT_125317 [Lottia gigantea]|uniref:G-protein coupled receptors family 2 profile 2 domain-containing protein n=1 Tax=Lottia gigantea TaxID=225164 RepID=V4A3C4_LOTGI|nr:hypothetical protein LOTGIDRAFT_125317 [Lottia gigantea]ESO89415.1 hypothetical protein LOTGIDRAFT_125317 [Lottia gigantea]